MPLCVGYALIRAEPLVIRRPKRSWLTPGPDGSRELLLAQTGCAVRAPEADGLATAGRFAARLARVCPPERQDLGPHMENTRPGEPKS